MNVVPFPFRHRALPRPARGSAAPLAHPAMTFEEFVEINADAIWRLLAIGNRRSMTFNELAEQLWKSL